MTLSEILADETLRQHEFPVCRDRIFLAHAGVCPLPRRVEDAIAAYTRLCTAGDQEDVLPARFLPETRACAAKLIGAQPEEIALVGPTSLALSFIAGGLRWRKGDNMLVYFDDYPSNVYPWMALSDRGVEVRFVHTRELGRIQPADVLGAVDERTRLVALASCHFVAGYRLDYQAIGRRLHERNILFCLDAIQTLGAFPTSVEHVDFLAADAHKWLLGPCGAGIMYVRKDLQEKLAPTTYGWHNLLCPNYVAQEDLVFKPDARRYEAGTFNFLGLAGLRAALELVTELGVENIAAELLRKRAWLVPALKAKDYAVLHAEPPPENAGSIVTFYHPDKDMTVLHQELAAANIVTSLRANRAGRKFLRLSPHCYNTDAELHTLLERL